ncbi:MAG: hypothetical protein M1426_05070 [Patescibacteria group bacterium]|nr:hypothetical protein [Patescibacteria group bacterium]
MIKHIWSILAQKAIIEAQTNSLSLIGVLEELTVGINKSPNNKSSIVNVPISYEVVSYLSRDNEGANPEMKIEIFNPEGKMIKSFEYTVNWEKGKSRMRAKVNINGFVVDGEGNYMFRIELKEKGEYRTVAELPLLVKLTDELLPPKKTD